ncbi:MAG TPA: PhoH family protein, partial [Propionibacterium sp.]|nr:PhoH family protein [Propionibacterium sp.]
MLRFAEHNVVLPIVVITELEAKRHHPELGYFARTALRLLDDLRVEHGRLDTPLQTNDKGGNLRVELNHTDDSTLPAGFRLGDNDTRILAVALNYANEGHDVVLVTKDVPLRVKAAAVGLAAEEYRNDMVLQTGYTGMTGLDATSDDVDALYEDGQLTTDTARDITMHSGVVVNAPGSSALARKMPDGSVRLIKHDREVFGLRGRSAEQRVALDLLMDDSVGIVSLGGRAGTGKSALALCAGLDAVL